VGARDSSFVGGGESRKNKKKSKERDGGRVLESMGRGRGITCIFFQFEWGERAQQGRERAELRG
jgi:hypothetical protein